MFKLHVIQAQFGDCLLLEYGTAADPHFTLIDGGPPGIYERHLKTVLTDVRQRADTLDCVILSHVDADHIVGLQDYVADLRAQAGHGALPNAKVLWHNAFDDAVPQGAEIVQRLEALSAIANAAGQSLSHIGIATLGIAEGHALRQAANALQLPVNDGFTDDLIMVDTSPDPITLENLTLRVVGPTSANLEALRDKWIEWLEKHEPDFLAPDAFVMAMADRSVPNLSSIQLLVEGGGKSLLLTGDGRGDHLLQGLEQAGLLDDDGNLHVDILKMPHHGSDRNVNKKFFTHITADKYVFSADGKDNNPDFATLMWVVETAAEAGREIQLIVTNEPPSVEKLQEEYPANDWGYTLRILPRNRHKFTIDIA